jgi:putative drug exporter of the RND superfamily
MVPDAAHRRRNRHHVVLVWEFGGLLAAALPMAVGASAIVASMAVLRTIVYATDVSTYALNPLSG